VQYLVEALFQSNIWISPAGVSALVNKLNLDISFSALPHKLYVDIGNYQQLFLVHSYTSYVWISSAGEKALLHQ
jgi:hypothetical protein